MLSTEPDSFNQYDPSYITLKNLFLTVAKKKGVNVFSFLRERKEKGLETYGEVLRTNNGRDALEDCLEELADGLMYYVQHLLEEDEKGKEKNSD